MKKYWLTSTLVFLLLIMSSPLGFADELILEFDPDEVRTEEDVLLLEAEEGLGESESTAEESLEPEGVSQQPSVNEQYVEGYRQLFELNQDEIAGLEAVLIPVEEDISSLDTQLQVLRLQGDRVQRQIGVVQQKMAGLRELDNKQQIQERLLALEMKDVVKKFERMLVMFFRVKRQFVLEDGGINLIQLFSTAPSPADLMFQDFLLQRVQDQLLEQMQDVYLQQLQLDQLRRRVQTVQLQLVLDQERLQESNQVLIQQASFKQELLRDKQDEEQFFLQQLEEAREEQQIILSRIQELATGVSSREYEQFPQENFIWPVTPVLGISAHFRDKAYRTRFGLDHNAIDIPTDQLTPIRAPLSGRVLKVHNAGMGYSYVQLGHRDGLSTVYGHIYSFKVEEGDIIKRGQVIALSGGAVGTRGAGRLTTGPHLHFEVLKNGKHVDPRLFLPELKD